MQNSEIKYYNDKVFLTPLQHNILRILHKYGPKIRSELVNQLKIPRTTIYDNLLKLQQWKVLGKYIRYTGKRGRPFVVWKIQD